MLILSEINQTQLAEARIRRNQLQNLQTVWSALSPQKRLLSIGATIAVFIAVLLLARGSNDRDMSLLFGGLEPAAAGNIVTALDQRGTYYEVRGNAIYVNKSDRDALRLSLAGDGLPATGLAGYELLDSLSGFGTTSQMFDAAYWRAKEGELARTIMANPNVQNARVHISAPNSRGFQRAQAPSAALTVQTIGAQPTAKQIKALQYLVAAAVPGLVPKAVAVIDNTGGLLSEREGVANTGTSDERADLMRLRAERLLAARVGPGNAVVEVTIETITEAEQITERRFDPEQRVAISTDITESSSKSQDSGSGAVTVASNLSDGDAGAGETNKNNEDSESRALTNFEVSETQRLLTRTPGDVKRLTVAVLVNEVLTPAADGTVTSSPRPQAELDALEALVSSAVGLNPDRGDVITLRSLAFEPILPMGTEALSIPNAGIDVMRLAQALILAVVAIILGLFVVRPILSPARLTVLDTSGGPVIDQDGRPVGTPPIAANTDTDSAISLPDQTAANPLDATDPVTRLRQMISERETETIQVLQNWMDPDETKENA